MKFREEVLSKIFTYITVILLLGIVAFEAYLLQTERYKKTEAEQEAQQYQNDLTTAREINFDLQTKNTELEKFYTAWSGYAAFSESVQAEKYKGDLFSRSALIPDEAVSAWKEKQIAGLSEKYSDPDEKEASFDPEKMDMSAEDTALWKALEELEFTFDNPNGINLFLPFGDANSKSQSYLIYTAAFLSDGEGMIELLFELPFEKNTLVPLYDENDEIIWNCIAYNIGDGWYGIRTAEEGEEE